MANTNSPCHLVVSLLGWVVCPRRLLSNGMDGRAWKFPRTKQSLLYKSWRRSMVLFLSSSTTSSQIDTTMVSLVSWISGVFAPSTNSLQTLSYGLFSITTLERLPLTNRHGKHTRQLTDYLRKPWLLRYKMEIKSGSTTTIWCCSQRCCGKKSDRQRRTSRSASSSTPHFQVVKSTESCQSEKSCC